MEENCYFSLTIIFTCLTFHDFTFEWKESGSDSVFQCKRKRTQSEYIDTNIYLKKKTYSQGTFWDRALNTAHKFGHKKPHIACIILPSLHLVAQFWLSMPKDGKKILLYNRRTWRQPNGHLPQCKLIAEVGLKKIPKIRKGIHFHFISRLPIRTIIAG